MYIDQKLCKRCLDCRPICPVEAIVVQDKKVAIEYEACVECGVCLRMGICKEAAIKQVDKIPYPRILRSVFSDVLSPNDVTGVSGRGTEEMKTNDVTNLFTTDGIGFSIELGRPGLGAYLSELEKVIKKVTEMGFHLALDNPVYALIADHKQGTLQPEVRKEKVLSAIAEFIVPFDRALDAIEELAEFLNNNLETVATMSVITRADYVGSTSFRKELRRRGFKTYPNGKVNIGLAAL